MSCAQIAISQAHRVTNRLSAQRRPGATPTFCVGRSATSGPPPPPLKTHMHTRMRGALAVFVAMKLR